MPHLHRSWGQTHHPNSTVRNWLWQPYPFHSLLQKQNPTAPSGISWSLLDEMGSSDYLPTHHPEKARPWFRNAHLRIRTFEIPCIPGNTYIQGGQEPDPTDLCQLTRKEAGAVHSISFSFHDAHEPGGFLKSGHS